MRVSTDQGPRRFSVGKAILAAGALAAAIGSIVGLGTTVSGWFKEDPPGTVRGLKIQSIRPLTYREWRAHEDVSNKGVPSHQLAAPGKLVSFDLDTDGYKEQDELPIRIIVHDVTNRRSRTFVADPARVTAGEDCGCFDWVAVPRGRSRYYLEVAVYPPGAIRGDPLKSVASGYFGPSGPS